MKFIYTPRYEKQLEKCTKQNKDMNLLGHIIILLENNQKKELNDVHKDHRLKGKLNCYRECHVKPHGKKTSWILVYERLENGDIKLIATGDESDVFTKNGGGLRSDIYNKFCSIFKLKGERTMNEDKIKYKIKQAVEKKLYDEENLSLVSLGEDDDDIVGTANSAKELMDVIWGKK